jgi:hypothetical protein
MLNPNADLVELMVQDKIKKDPDPLEELIRVGL